MDWKKWLTFNPYKKLWSLIGGRPWTYIMRDFYHEVEYLIILSFFTLGYFSYRWLSLRDFIIIILSLSAGYVLGHLFWGRKWIRGQKGDGNGTNNSS